MFLAVSSLLFVSCTKDEDSADPQIYFQNSQTSLEFDGTNSVDVNITFEAEGEIESVFMIRPTFTGTQSVDITKQMGMDYDDNGRGNTTATYFFKVSNSLIDSMMRANLLPMQYTFTLTDKDDRVTTATFEITLKAAPTTPLTVAKSGSFYHIGGSLEGAYDLVNDVRVAASGAATSKFIKNTNQVGDPFTGAWKSDNGTKFVKVTGFDYANATEEAAMTAYAAGTELTTVIPAVNDMFIAKHGTTYFVIKITALDPLDNTCQCGNKGKISFDYKKK
jgi:hypothetical protein